MRRVVDTEQILAALPAEQQEIAAITGASPATVWRRIEKLHAARQIHIVGWRRSKTGGSYIPKYARGEGEDAPCPLVPLSNADRLRARRARVAGRADVGLCSQIWAGAWARLVRPEANGARSD